VPSFLSKPARLFFRVGLGPGQKAGFVPGSRAPCFLVIYTARSAECRNASQPDQISDAIGWLWTEADHTPGNPDSTRELLQLCSHEGQGTQVYNHDQSK
jgi:hypothetical protein